LREVPCARDPALKQRWLCAALLGCGGQQAAAPPSLHHEAPAREDLAARAAMLPLAIDGLEALPLEWSSCERARRPRTGKATITIAFS
jgi:hypothetical protein